MADFQDEDEFGEMLARAKADTEAARRGLTETPSEQTHSQGRRSQAPEAPTWIQREPVSLLLEEAPPAAKLARARAERRRFLAAIREARHPKWCKLHLEKGLYYTEFQVKLRKPGEEIGPEELRRRCEKYFEMYTLEELLIFSLEVGIQEGVPEMVRVEVREGATDIVTPPKTARLKELSAPDWERLGM